MDINHISVYGLRKDYITRKNNRAKLDTGFFCNYKCEFCYYINNLHLKTSLLTIKERIDKIASYGIEEIDLSGGESSIHKDWFEILDYCKEKFKKISCLSNGSAFSNEKFLIKSKDHGLSEILFSLHGYNEENHDMIVGISGAWKKIHKAIRLCQENNIRVRINCTVYQKNHAGLEEYSKIIKKIKPYEVNFLTLNYWDDSRTFEPITDYRTLTDNIKKCIDLIKDEVSLINVRYTPYCYMEGYEKYVCNQYQHIYDIYDWNKEIYDLTLDTSKAYTHEEKVDIAYEQAKKDRLATYKKPIACVRCKFFNICDGIEKPLNIEVHPIRGEKIRDVNYFRKDFYEGCS
jgi:MoaA/NifB/PqqE/SkfB family radical SAM enzyme